MMVGRLLLVILVMVALLWAPPAVRTQETRRVPRIGILTLSAPEHPEGRMPVDVFRQALGERGYVEGRNIVIEYRWAEGRIERLPAPSPQSSSASKLT